MPVIIKNEIGIEGIRHIITRHRILYDEFGFNDEFGDYVEKTLSEPFERLWIAEIDEAFAGCIGIVKTDSDNAQLRWFLVEPNARGMGIGKRLMQELIDFCRAKGYKNIFLWTVNKLPAARKIYEAFDFRLTESKSETLLWGQILSEQRWDLSL
jgi:GNAT superfamily N-acetyltransferase